VDVEGIPEGDDYFCVFMDSYDGTVSVSEFEAFLLGLSPVSDDCILSTFTFAVP
jgi:hypothetical protein